MLNFANLENPSLLERPCAQMLRKVSIRRHNVLCSWRFDFRIEPGIFQNFD